MKTFFSCLDQGCSNLLTQRLQHLIVGDMASRNDGRISFYTMEDPVTLTSQAVLRRELNKDQEIDGVVYFRLKQFAYGESFDFGFLTWLLDAGLEVHFSREDFSVLSHEDLEFKFPVLHCFDTSGRDDQSAILRSQLR